MNEPHATTMSLDSDDEGAGADDCAVASAVTSESGWPYTAGGNGNRMVADPRWRPGAGHELIGWGMTPSGAVARVELPWEATGGHGPLRGARVLIVDDCVLYREYLAAVIAANGGKLPSVAWNLSSLTAAIEEVVPNVILLNMATRENVTLLRQALKLNPHVRVIALGMLDDDEEAIVACAEAGVAGYHMRTESLEDLLLLIGRVVADESVCSPKVSAILLRRLSTLASQRRTDAKDLDLTAREAQILRMLELGQSNREIAAELCIAVHTVKNHVHSLLNKLGVSTRAQAAALSRTIAYPGSDPRD